VVAFRSHQVRPQRDDHNSDTSAATEGSYRFEKFEPCRAQQGTGIF
jgi:hypothetical protein